MLSSLYLSHLYRVQCLCSTHICAFFFPIFRRIFPFLFIFFPFPLQNKKESHSNEQRKKVDNWKIPFAFIFCFQFSVKLLSTVLYILFFFGSFYSLSCVFYFIFVALRYLSMYIFLSFSLAPSRCLLLTAFWLRYFSDTKFMSFVFEQHGSNNWKCFWKLNMKRKQQHGKHCDFEC